MINSKTDKESVIQDLYFQTQIFLLPWFLEANFTVWRIMHTLMPFGYHFETSLRSKEKWCMSSGVWGTAIHTLLWNLRITVLSEYFEEKRHARLVQGWRLVGQRKLHAYLIVKCRWRVVRCYAVRKIKLHQLTFAWASYQSESSEKPWKCENRLRPYCVQL
jgi:hypothetical protein